MSLLESIFYMMWRGVAIGVLISAPMGPVGILCIQRTLDKGRKAGFYTGIGASLSDLFYCLLTGFGLSFIEEFIERNSSVIQLFGSVVLIAFGIYLLKKNPTRRLKRPVDVDVSVKKNILGGFLFTFSNPLILFLIIGLFARFNFLNQEFRIYHYFIGFLFILLGALAWWWVVTFFIDKVRAHFNLRSMWLINRIIGIIILIFAVVGIVSAMLDLTSTQAKADTIYLNPRRGYNASCPNISDHDEAPLEITEGSPLILKAPESGWSSPLCVDARLSNEKGGDWLWSFRDEEGNELMRIVIRNEEKDDGISTYPAMEFRVMEYDRSGDVSGEYLSTFPIGMNLRHEHTVYRMLKDENGWLLSAGFFSLSPILEFKGSDRIPASIEIKTAGKGKLKLHELKLCSDRIEESVVRGLRLSGDFSPEDYFSGSKDLMEGFWRVFDRTLDEDLIRLGGDYRLAIMRRVDSPNSYDIYYISGATVNSSAWECGDLKGRLESSGVDGVWNMTWWDAMKRPMSKDIKVQTNGLNTLQIQFPYQNSTLRLQKEDL